MQTEPSTKGIAEAEYVKLLELAFTGGAKGKKPSAEAKQYPLKKYEKNIERLARQCPDVDSVEGLVCAHQAGKLAAEAAVGLTHASIEEADMIVACKKLEEVDKEFRGGKGPVCRIE